MSAEIIVVEDNPLIVQVLLDEFRNHGIKIVGTSSVEEGLKLLDQNDAKILVSGPQYFLPSNRRFVEAAREACPAIKIILVGKEDWPDQALSRELILEKIFLVPYTIEWVLERRALQNFTQVEIDSLFG